MRPRLATALAIGETVVSVVLGWLWLRAIVRAANAESHDAAAPARSDGPGAPAGAATGRAGGLRDRIARFEMTQLLGLMYRHENVTPARLDELMRLLRQVYPGLYPAQSMSIEPAIDFFCPEQTPEQPSAESQDSSSGCTVH